MNMAVRNMMRNQQGGEPEEGKKQGVNFGKPLSEESVVDNTSATTKEVVIFFVIFLIFTIILLALAFWQVKIEKMEDGKKKTDNKRAIKFIYVMLYLVGILYIIMYLISGNYTFGKLNSLFTSPILLLVVSYLIMMGTMHGAYISAKNKEPTTTLHTFLGFHIKDTKAIIGGMITYFIFGFIDNLGLFVGMDSLDPIFGKMGLGELQNAGAGNTFSDFIGAFVGSSIGNMTLNYMGVEETPLWTEPAAIILGCLVGVIVPSLFTRNFNEPGILNKVLSPLSMMTILISIVIILSIVFTSKKTPVETESTEPETQKSVVNPVQATTNAAPVNTTQIQTTPAPTQTQTTPAPTQVPVNAQPEETI